MVGWLHHFSNGLSVKKFTNADGSSSMVSFGINILRLNLMLVDKTRGFLLRVVDERHVGQSRRKTLVFLPVGRRGQRQEQFKLVNITF